MEDREISDILIRWYEENKRDLPWRRTSDPYLIWISEIILQQTRVVQGLEYFNRFTERFPDVAALARADEDEVMKYWQGLGYYSRARNLHAAARQIMNDFSGVFPRTREEVLSLKGIGDYLPQTNRLHLCSGYLFFCLPVTLCNRGRECIPGIGPVV